MHLISRLLFIASCIGFFVISCQTNPVVHQATDTDSSSDSDSEITDWNYDTGDSFGGPDQECYSKTADSVVTVWCDTPEIIAQQCEEFDSGCCCRAPCSPSLCQGLTETVPCSYFDLTDEMGVCTLSLDSVPVYYACNGNCTPRSQCLNYREDGYCLDSDAADAGQCLLYEEGNEVIPYCQLTCTMAFCDDTHMCLPMYNSAGNYSGSGACHPIY